MKKIWITLPVQPADSMRPLETNLEKVVAENVACAVIKITSGCKVFNLKNEVW